MNHVIRRLGFALFFVLSLSACGVSGDVTSVRIDDASMDREQLIDMTALFSTDTGVDVPPTLDAEFARLVGTTFVRDTVLVQYLEGKGFPLSDELLEQLAAQRGPQLAAENFRSVETQQFVTDFLAYNDFAALNGPNLYDGEVPGIWLDPPVINDPAVLQIPELLGSPQIAADPTVLNDPAFQAQLLADPNVVGLLRQIEFDRRTIELTTSSSPDVEVESRLGVWDEEAAAIVPHG